MKDAKWVINANHSQRCKMFHGMKFQHRSIRTQLEEGPVTNFSQSKNQNYFLRKWCKSWGAHRKSLKFYLHKLRKKNARFKLFASERYYGTGEHFVGVVPLDPCALGCYGIFNMVDANPTKHTRVIILSPGVLIFTFSLRWWRPWTMELPRDLHA